MTNKETELKYKELVAGLKSGKKEIVLSTINDIKSVGQAKILSHVFELFNSSTDSAIHEEIIKLLANLRIQECVPYIVDALKSNIFGEHTAAILATCWQSRLDYSDHLSIFAQQFIDGSYQVSIEAFTVIEETVMDREQSLANKCKAFLLEQKNNISEEKKPLFDELIKVLSA